MTHSFWLYHFHHCKWPPFGKLGNIIHSGKHTTPSATSYTVQLYYKGFMSLLGQGNAELKKRNNCFWGFPWMCLPPPHQCIRMQIESCIGRVFSSTRKLMDLQNATFRSASFKSQCFWVLNLRFAAVYQLFMSIILKTRGDSYTEDV